ncbi:hypothetical protein [Mesorhizobium sp.]|uniref:hypothetical protein n=1 Tax=Mesorhizobium sp. TaxID=1871066 RepID=UPI001215C081|nr:hypothetical protein [Mesorhizobium sp.]TIR91629.1 MAG: hypothetical protein E5X08_17925 [Mesorhizobium sp.]
MKEAKRTSRKSAGVQKAGSAPEQLTFSTSNKAMMFSETRVRRFIKTLEKHKVLADFILDGRVDANRQVKLTAKEINKAKSLLFGGKAHVKDTFARSMVGNGEIPSTDPKRCPHHGK